MCTVIAHMKMFLLLHNMAINSQNMYFCEIMWFGALICSALKHSKVPLKFQAELDPHHNFLGF